MRLVILCIVSVALARDSAAQPKFETASVKQMERGVIHNSLGPGTVVLRGDPLRVVLMEAFGVKTWQIVGPAWLDEDCFEIVAKIPEGVTSDQVPAMLQSLLAERFKLSAHKEDRPRPIYALVVDRGGPKFKEASPNFNRLGMRPGQVMFRTGSSNTGFKGALTMTQVASFLSHNLDRPVQDFTGLTGKYDIDLAWTPDPAIDRPMPAAASFTAAQAAAGDRPTDAPAPSLPSIFTAIRQSLGLALEARKEPVQMLVIDHVERVPTEN